MFLFLFYIAQGALNTEGMALQMFYCDRSMDREIVYLDQLMEINEN